jgi:hypothetical protein
MVIQVTTHLTGNAIVIPIPVEHPPRSNPLLPVTTTKSTAMSKVQNSVSKSIPIYLYKYHYVVTMEIGILPTIQGSWQAGTDKTLQN